MPNKRLQRLALAGCGLALCVSAFATEPLSILGYTQSESFWVELPKGWRCDADAAKSSGAMFILLPEGVTFDSAPSVIVASAYEDSALDEAMSRDRASFLSQDADIRISDRESIVAKSGARFSVRDFLSHRLTQQGYESVAYTKLGTSVVVLTLSAQTEAQFRSGQKVFRAVLGTFTDAKLKVAKLP